MADPHSSLVDLTSYEPPGNSPSLVNHIRPLLEHLQNFLHFLPSPDATHDAVNLQQHTTSTPQSAKNVNDLPPLPFSASFLARTPSAADAHLSTVNLDINASCTSPCEVTLATKFFDPDLDPHFTVDSTPILPFSFLNVSAHHVSEDSNPEICENHGKTHAFDSQKKSFLTVLCGAPDVLSVVVVDAPKMVGGTPLVEIDEEEYTGSLTKCSIHLLAKLTLMQGEQPYHTKTLKGKLDSLWHLPHPWKLIPLEKGYFCLRFTSKNDQDQIWGRGSIPLKPGVLRIMKWQRDFNPYDKKHVTAQLWVRFLHLPIEYWSPKILYGLAKAVGIPLRIDQATLNLDYGYFSRVLVDVDMLNPLPDHIMVQRKGHSFTVDLQFERVPAQCSHCGNLGHLISGCHLLKGVQHKSDASKPQSSQWETKKSRWTPKKHSDQAGTSTSQPSSRGFDIFPPPQQPAPLDPIYAHTLYNSDNPLAQLQEGGLSLPLAIPQQTTPLLHNTHSQNQRLSSNLQVQSSHFTSENKNLCPSDLPKAHEPILHAGQTCKHATQVSTRAQPSTHADLHLHANTAYQPPAAPLSNATQAVTSPSFHITPAPPAAHHNNAATFSLSLHPADAAHPPTNPTCQPVAHPNNATHETSSPLSRSPPRTHSAGSAPVPLIAGREDIEAEDSSPVVQAIIHFAPSYAPPPLYNSFAALEAPELEIEADLPPKHLQSSDSKDKVAQQLESSGVQAASSSPKGARLSASAAAFSPSAPSSYKEDLQQSSSVQQVSSKGKQSSSLAIPTQKDSVDDLDEGCFLMRQNSPSSSLIRELDARSTTSHSLSLVQEVDA